MHATQPNSFNLPHAQGAEHSESWMSTPLKILIVAVAAIAAAALGFLVAGLAALSIGAFTGGGLAAACLLLCSSREQNQQPVREREVFLAPGEICNGPITDPSIRWVTGVQSPYFAQLLALHRQSHDEGLPTIRSLRPPQGAEFTTYPLGRLTSIQRENPMYVLLETLEELAPFDLEKELERAHLLPGDTLIQNRINPGFYLNELQQIIGQILQRGVSNQQKQELRQHIQEKLLPIFASMDALLAQLDLFPENHNYVEQVRVANAGNPEYRPYNGILDETLVEYQHAAAKLLTLFETVQPTEFNADEQDLVRYPCPLIFASTTIDAHPLDPNEFFGRPGQLVIDQNELHLGQDLQYVYTTQPNIERIKSIVEPFHMQVRDLMTLTSPAAGQL